MNESYQCAECGNRFDFPDIIKETSEFWGSLRTDTYEVCPFCGSWAFDVVQLDEEANYDLCNN